MTIAYRMAARPRQDRFRFWSNLMCRTFAPAEGWIENADDFDAQFSVSRLGHTSVCTLSAPKQSWERTRQHVQRSPRNQYLLTQVLTGQGVLRQGGRQLELGPGMMSLYDVDRPYSYEVSGEVLFVKLPRQTLTEWLDLPPPVAAPLGTDTAIAGWASNVIRGAAGISAQLEPHTAQWMGDTVLSAVAAVINSQTEGADDPVRSDESSLLDRVCTFIRSRLGDPSLTLGAIARAQGLSERSLHRLFAALGTTPMRWVLQQRMTSSFQALEEGRARSVTEVAFAHGFNDLSHFSRVFKRMHGMPPRMVSGQRSTH